jgi:hypothetical protein
MKSWPVFLKKIRKTVRHCHGIKIEQRTEEKRDDNVGRQRLLDVESNIMIPGKVDSKLDISHRAGIDNIIWERPLSTVSARGILCNETGRIFGPLSQDAQWIIKEETRTCGGT